MNTNLTPTTINIYLSRKHTATLAFQSDGANVNNKLSAIQNVPVVNFIPSKLWFENYQNQLRKALNDDTVEIISVMETTGKYSASVVYGKLLYSPQYEGKTITVEGEKWKMESNGKMIKQD